MDAAQLAEIEARAALRVRGGALFGHSDAEGWWSILDDYQRDVSDLIADVRRLRAALAPILAAWDREAAGCDCRSAATVLRREWMDAARAALDGGAS